MSDGDVKDRHVHGQGSNRLEGSDFVHDLQSVPTRQAELRAHLGRARQVVVHQKDTSVMIYLAH